MSDRAQSEQLVELSNTAKDKQNRMWFFFQLWSLHTEICQSLCIGLISFDFLRRKKKKLMMQLIDEAVSLYRSDRVKITTWGKRVSLRRRRLLWTVWRHCPDPAAGKCPPRSGRVLWWIPHTSAPGLAPREAQNVARMLPCQLGFFQTLQRGQRVHIKGATTPRFNHKSPFSY